MALSYIQVLEGDPKHQKECWRTALDQDLANAEDLKRIIMRISKERHMNLVQEIKKEGHREGLTEGRRKTLVQMVRTVAPDLLVKCEKELLAADSLDEVQRLEEEISLELKRRLA